MKVDHPNCPAANELGYSPGSPVPISDHELGLVISCDQDDIRLVRWDVGGGPSVTIAELDVAGVGVAWSQRSGTVYFSSHSCANGGLRAQLGTSGICLTDDPDQRFPAVADDGSIIYLTPPKCGTDAPEPRFMFSVCRYDAQGETSTLARGMSGATGAVEVLAGSVVAHGGAGVGVAGGDLHVAEATPDIHGLSHALTGVAIRPIGPDGAPFGPIGVRGDRGFSCRWSR